jgi:hypothetical protein
MAQATKTTPRTGTGRFARSGAAQTKPKRKPQSSTPRSLPRATTRSRNRPTPTRFGHMPGRKPQQKKGIAGTLTGLIPTGAAAKATPSSKKGKAGGFAAVAALAGVAFTNREKLSGMLNRNKSGGEQVPTPVTPATTPAPVASGDSTSGL